MMRRAILVLAVLLTGCGRQMTASEMAFADKMFDSALDARRVRLAKGAVVGSVTFRRPARPRVTCRERILPPPTSDIVTASPAAVTLFNTVHFTDDWYVKNFAPDYPDRLYLVRAMLLAHELTHVWQWQHRDRTGYHPLKAAAEHQVEDPYLFELDEAPEFLSFGYEQQGAIVEEYVCCRALAPRAARTQRLHAMLSAAFPVETLPQSRESDVYLPWDKAELQGICD